MHPDARIRPSIPAPAEHLCRHRRRTTPVAWTRFARSITRAQLVTSLVLLGAFYLLLLAGFGFLQYLPYFRFFLLCLMGAAFLVITYLLRH